MPPILDGKYRLGERLAGGGMGVVYRARHLGLDKPCAVKLIQPRHRDDPAFFRRFHGEAEILGSLEHPHVVRVTDFGVDPHGGGVAYLVMELLEGQSLELACRGGPWTIARALPVLAAVAAALDHAHRQGVLHCDLKAENVFLRAGVGEAAGVRLLDFGLARLGEAEPGAEDAVREESGSPDQARLLGTPLYLAPELTRGLAPTAAADVYAFGVLTYRLLTGRFPFAGDPATLRRQHLSSPPPPPSSHGAPGELDTPLLAALAKDPARRPGSAGEVVATLAVAARRGWWRRHLPRRLGMASAASALAVIAAAAAGRLPPLAALEDSSLDLRLLLSPSTEPDARLLLLTLDDGDLGPAEAPLAERDGELASLLSAVLQAGASRVAVDHLLPFAWSESQPFVELVLRHPGRLALAVATTAEGDTVGEEVARGWIAGALGPEGVAGLFVHSHLDLDPDGSVRRGRRGYRDVSGGWRPTLGGWLADPEAALAGAASEGAFLLDLRADWRRLDAWSWRDARRRLERDPTQLRGRLVLAGGAFTGSGDQHRVPGPRGRPARASGLALQALTAHTLLAGLPLRPVAPGAGLALFAPLALAAAAAPLVLERLAPAAAVAGAALLYVALSTWLFARWGLVAPLVAPLAALLLGAAACWLLARRLPAPPTEEIRG